MYQPHNADKVDGTASSLQVARHGVKNDSVALPGFATGHKDRKTYRKDAERRPPKTVSAARAG